MGCFGAGDLVYCVSAGSSAAGAGLSAFQEGPSYFAPMSDGGLGSWTTTAALPTPIVANFAVAGTKVYYLAVPTLVAELAPSGISPWAPTVNPPGPWWASTCFAYENYLFCVTPGSDETCFADIGQLTASSVEPNDPPPFSNPDFLHPAWSGSGGCSVSANGQSAGAPCFGGDIDWAVTFDCAAEAATSAGCKTTVVSELDTSYNYDMTIWYPCSQAPGPDANCCFQQTGYDDTPTFGWCISTGSNSFIISKSQPSASLSATAPCRPRWGPQNSCKTLAPPLRVGGTVSYELPPIGSVLIVSGRVCNIDRRSSIIVHRPNIAL